MEQVVFSRQKNTLRVVKDGSLIAYNIIDGEAIIIASTFDYGDGTPILPSTLIRTPKSDEELAEEMYKDYEFSQIKTRGIFHDDRLRELDKSTFLAGRKSFGDKKYHLSEEELETLINSCRLGNSSKWQFTIDNIIEAFTPPPIYPHTITVEHDGNNYLWETLKAEY